MSRFPLSFPRDKGPGRDGNEVSLSFRVCENAGNEIKRCVLGERRPWERGYLLFANREGPSNEINCHTRIPSGFHQDKKLVLSNLHDHHCIL